MRTKPNTSSLASELADRLRRRIQAESLEDGDLFMTEAQLATEYEVSRTVVREAVSRLLALGILEGRQRKGLVVRRPDPLRLLSESLPSLATSSEDLRELGQLRYALEIGAIELVIRSATDEQIEELGRLTEVLVGSLRNGDSQTKTKAHDLAFHTHLLQMTGSSLIAGMQKVLVKFFETIDPRSLDEAARTRIIWEHTELFAAIRDRDVERARTMIRMQLRQTLEQVPPPVRGG